MLKLLIVCITTNWKILQEMGISDHLACLLRNLYADQEVQEYIELYKKVLMTQITTVVWSLT